MQTNGFLSWFKKARRYGLEPTFSRSGRFKSMSSKSYWSYGKVNYKDGAMIPEGLEHPEDRRPHPSSTLWT
jgi:hypothetical protein